MPTSIYRNLENDPTAWLQSEITKTGTQDWYSAVPSSALGVLSSVGNEEIAIISKDVTGPAPTNVARIAGAALAAGAAALAVL